MTTAIVLRTPDRIPPFLEDGEVVRVLERAQAAWQAERRPCRRFQAHRDLALLLTLFHTGIRIGEATRLVWGDVDFVGHTVRVRTEKKRKMSWRVVPVAAELTAALLLYRHEGEAHAAGRHGRRASLQCRMRRGPFEIHPRRAWARLHRLMLEAGIDGGRAHPHVFRHTYAVRAVRAGMPPMMLARLLGHSSPTVTMVYYHLLGTDVRPFVERMKVLTP
ncbi:Tyrosine recombinase XerC [bacterium HR11]|nr:Tyrosine recombinase XerC [bacterium HR11]